MQFYADGSVAEYPDGTQIGLLSMEDLVDDSNEAMGNIEWKNLNLYYADKLGDKLVKHRLQSLTARTYPWKNGCRTAD